MSEDESDTESLRALLADALTNLAEEVDDDEEMGTAVYDLYQDASEPTYTTILEAMDESLADWRDDLNGFQGRLYDDWEEPIDLLEGFIIYCQDLGLEIDLDLREQAAEENDLVYLALVQLHARGIQIAREILTLLKHGFADGAHARWRALHEIAAVGMFIRLSGQETAKRFLLHSQIDDYHQAKAIRNYPDTEMFGGISDEEMEELTEKRDHLIDMFGPAYDRHWGWAAHELGDRPRFKDIEEAAGLEHHRPYHMYASKLNIHAGSKGTMGQLGMTESRSSQTTSRPTSYGFTLPGTHTAISLGQITTTLLTHRVSIELLLDMVVVQRFIDDIKEAFPTVQLEIERREEEMWEDFIEEELEDPLDEFLEEYESSPLPVFEILLDEEGDDES